MVVEQRVASIRKTKVRRKRGGGDGATTLEIPSAPARLNAQGTPLRAAERVEYPGQQVFKVSLLLPQAQDWAVGGRGSLVLVQLALRLEGAGIERTGGIRMCS
jgi:hypothetical protein